MAIVVGYVATKEGRAALKRAAEECLLRQTKLIVISSHRGGKDFDADESARFEAELTRIQGLLTDKGLERISTAPRTSISGPHGLPFDGDSI